MISSDDDDDGNNDDEEEEDKNDCCPVCLDDPPVHPVPLECGHVYCFLCVKGIVEKEFFGASCSLCRTRIPLGYLNDETILQRSDSEMMSKEEVDNQEDYQWMYQGKNGWWRFEERHNREIEDMYKSGRPTGEILIVGHVYVMDFVNLCQYRKSDNNDGFGYAGPQGRKRIIKRANKNAQYIGIAGLVTKKSV